MDERQEFLNTTGGHIGAIEIDRRGERRPIAVAPGETVWLNEEEQEATANAPRDPSKNPFVEQDYEIRDLMTGEVTESGRRPQLELVTTPRPIGSRRPIGGSPQSQETGAAPAPAGDAPEGEYAAGEEVGTPALATAQDIRVTEET